jgi:hypothetical protein
LFSTPKYLDHLFELTQQENEGDHSPPSSVEFKEEWSYTSTLPYAFIYLYFTARV